MTATNAIDTTAVRSLPAMFFEQAARQGDKPFLWQKQNDVYQPLSWRAVAEKVAGAARGLRAAGVKPGDRVMLVAENRPEWLIIDLAVMSIGGVTVPAYTTNTAVNHLHIINDSGARVIVAATAQLARPLIAAAAEANHKATVYVIDEADNVLTSEVKVLPWSSVMTPGDAKPPEEMAGLNRGDLCCVIYTSGTGGLPRGVMLTHGNILSNCAGATDLLATLDIGDEVFLCFLPLSHAYEHTAGQFFPISCGAQIYYAERIDTLSTNMQEARPTIMTAVPRLYESMRQKILAGLKRQSALKRKMFDIALTLGRKRYETPDQMTFWDKTQDAIVEKLVRGKVRARFGGRLKSMISGGAPLNYDVGVFFIALGVPMLQGYGQTEAAPIISANPPKRVKLRTVGPPLKGVEVKIGADGEILVRGELVMKGYWNDPDGTIATIDNDGWLHTGDIGHLDADGYIEITDRKKDIIVNSGGDNVSPQRVQGALEVEEGIAQSLVYGDRKPYLTAVIVPDVEFAATWAVANNAETDVTALAANQAFRNVIGKQVEHANMGLGTTEKVRKFVLATQAFTVENGQMTPTMKVRRHAILREYRDKLEALYV